MYDSFGELHGGSDERHSAGGQSSTQPFWGFTLSGNASLKDVAHFYGLHVAGLEANLTLHGYLCRSGNGHLEPGMHVMTKPFAMEAMATRIKALIEGR